MSHCCFHRQAEKVPEALKDEAAAAVELDASLPSIGGPGGSTRAAAAEKEQIQHESKFEDTDRITAALKRNPTHAPIVKKAKQPKAEKKPKLDILPPGTQIDMLDLNDLTLYEALDDETPKKIANKLSVPAKSIVTLNRDRYPGS